MDFISRGFIYGKIKLQHLFEGLRNEEAGVTAIVATVLLIVIVVALAALFWEKISAWFEEMWIKITGKADPIGG